MDLSTIEGLTDEQKAAILEAHNTDVTGLKSKNTQLMDEAKNAKSTSAEKDAAVEEARKAAVAAKEKQLLSENKYEEAQKLREEERATLVAKANENAEKYKSALDNQHLSNAKNGVLNKVVDGMQGFAEAMLDKSVSVSYDEEGNAQAVFRHGEKEFTTAADFINGVSDDVGWSNMLKGADSSGAGAKQSNNSGGASSSSIDKTQSALKQRLQQKGLT